MKKAKIEFEIIKEEIGYSASSVNDGYAIFTDGVSLDNLKSRILEATNLTFEDKNIVYNIDEIDFKYDLKSFFEFYKVINAKALSERIGMNQSLLAQYINGIKKPSSKQTQRIINGVREIGRELTEVHLIV